MSSHREQRVGIYFVENSKNVSKMIATSKETLLTSGNRELHAEVEQGIRLRHILQFSSEIQFLSWDSSLTKTMHMIEAKLNKFKLLYDRQ